MLGLQFQLSERSYGTICLAFTVFFLFADQNLLAPNLSAVAEDFGMSVEEKDKKLGGMLSVGFFIIAAPAALIAGFLADKYPRTNLLGIVVLIGEVSCIATYYVETYEQLLVLRVLTGIGVGGAIPIIYSLLADFYSEESRVLASSGIGIACSAGTSFGQLFAGIFGPRIGWRLPFLINAIPALFCGALMFFTVSEPISNAGSIGESINVAKVKSLLSTPTVILAYLQGIPGCIPWGLLQTFYIDYLSTERGLTISHATFILSLFGFGALIGQLFGGYIGQFLFNRKPLYQVILMGTSTMLGVIPTLYMINAPGLGDDSNENADINTLYMMSVLAGFFAAITGPNIKMVLANVSPPEIRGTAFAFFACTDDIGKGLGPFLVYNLIKTYNGDKAAAYDKAVTAWVACSVVLFLLVFCYERDVVKMRSRTNELSRLLDKDEEQGTMDTLLGNDSDVIGSGLQRRTRK